VGAPAYGASAGLQGRGRLPGRARQDRGKQGASPGLKKNPRRRHTAPSGPWPARNPETPRRTGAFRRFGSQASEKASVPAIAPGCGPAGAPPPTSSATRPEPGQALEIRLKRRPNLAREPAEGRPQGSRGCRRSLEPCPKKLDGAPARLAASLTIPRKPLTPLGIPRGKLRSGGRSVESFPKLLKCFPTTPIRVLKIAGRSRRPRARGPSGKLFPRIRPAEAGSKPSVLPMAAGR
jgi:hypothetical protein